MFSLQLWKDFQPTALPRLSSIPGSLPALAGFTRFHLRFSMIKLCHNSYFFANIAVSQ
jgi:hypothetical protein